MSVITFTEFTSPHVYAFGDCCMRQGVPKQCINLAGTDGLTGFKDKDWKTIPFSLDPLVSSAISAMFTNQQSQISDNTEQIECLNKNIGQLVFELLQQGIKIEDKDLLNKLNYIK